MSGASCLEQAQDTSKAWFHHILALIVVVVCLFFILPKRLGQFDSGVGTTRELVSSEADFARAHPATGYTCVLSELPRNGKTPKVSDSGESFYYSVEIRGCRVGQPRTAFQLLVRAAGEGHRARDGAQHKRWLLVRPVRCPSRQSDRRGLLQLLPPSLAPTVQTTFPLRLSARDHYRVRRSESGDDV